MSFEILHSGSAKSEPTVPSVIQLEKGRIKLYGCYSAPEFNYSVFFEGAKSSTIEFFKNIGFGLYDSELPQFMEVFFSRESILERLCPIFKVEPDSFPEAFGGTVYDKFLFLSSENIYKASFIKLFGENLWNEDEFLRLAIHELIHSGHAAIARKIFGTEDGMGPVWFFEGLAIAGSNQFISPEDALIIEKPLTEKEIRDFERAANNRTIQKPVYPKFGIFYRRLLQKLNQKWLIENAGKSNFLEMMIEKYLSV